MSSYNFTQKLKTIWTQSLKDSRAINFNGKGYSSRVYKCVKIVKDDHTEAIAIYNTKGLFSKEITEEQYGIFIQKGWSEGVKAIQIHNLNKEAVRLRVLIQQQTYTKALLNKLKKVKDELEQIIGGEYRPPN
tara:strand:- start:184 stop:579 length:396 start_codon:yes stop_codon:yes gene_type:complete